MEYAPDELAPRERYKVLTAFVLPRPIDVNGDRQLIMGEGINFHIRDQLWDRDAMRMHMDRYHPVGRMFADRYCRTDDRMVFPPAQGAPVA